MTEDLELPVGGKRFEPGVLVDEEEFRYATREARRTGEKRQVMQFVEICRHNARVHRDQGDEPKADALDSRADAVLLQHPEVLDVAADVLDHI